MNSHTLQITIFPQQLPSEQDAKFTGPKGRSQIPAGARNHKIKIKVLLH